MSVILKIIKKNFKLLARSKSSALVVILGPLLLIFLVGIAFDTSNTYNINIGIFSEGYNNLTDSFVGKLKEHNFNVKKMVSESECVDQIRQGKVNTCIVFPADMSFDVPNVTNDVIFYIDYSKINLVWMIIDTITEKISATESEVSADLAGVLLNKLEFTKNSIFEKRPLLSSLKTQVSDSLVQIKKIKDELDKLDVSMNTGDFKVSDLNAKNDEIKAMIDSLQSDASIRLSEIAVSLNSTKIKVNGLNTTVAAKDNVLESFSPIESNVNSIKFNLDKKVNISRSGWLDMQSAISGFDAALNGVKSKLDAAASTKVGSSKDIDTIKSLLDSSANNLVELEKSLNAIDASIASIRISNAEDIANPISTVIKPVSQESTQLNYLFPSLAVLVIMFISILLSTTIIMMEKHSPAHFRNFITPTKDITFVLGTYFTSLIVVMVQVVVILIVSSYFFHTQIISSIFSIGLFLLIIASLFTFVGMAIGYLFNSEETATLASISVGTIFLFLSNTILPLESMPAYISQVAKFNPFVISESLLRKAILFNPPIFDLLGEIMILVSYVILLFVFVWLLQKVYKNDYVHRITSFEQKFFQNRKGLKFWVRK